MALSPSEEEIVEIPLSELQGIFNELIGTYNLLNDLLKDQGILRDRELAELNTQATQSLKAEKWPMSKINLLNAFIRKQITHIKKALQARPPAKATNEGRISQAITKIQLRALAIIEHINVMAEGKKEVAFNSSQARQFLAGREGKPPSRRDAIRALWRVGKICPALVCDHTPNDGRQTMRLIAKVDDLKHSEFINPDMVRDRRQRSRIDEAMVIFGFKEPGPGHY